MRFLISILTLLTIFSCENDGIKSDPSQPIEHIKYFGFSLIDVYWDDPLDAEVKTNYIDEVSSFTNIADILVLNPEDNIINRLQLMNTNTVKAYLHLNELFFELVDANAPSGSNYNLRSDYKERWNLFLQNNDLIGNSSLVQAFYLGEEPTWNGISFQELKLASDYIKSTTNDIPILLIEAHPILSELQVPESVDWVGFDHYFIKDPKNDPAFLNELTVLKSKISNDDQKLVLVLDSHYIQEIHGDLSNISQIEMALVANSYYELAQSEPKVIALIGYTWPGGFDTTSALGARQLPQQVKDEYIRIGKEITGK